LKSSVHNWYDPAVKIYKRATDKGISLITPIISQITDIENLPTQKKWWEDFIKFN